MTFYPMLPNHAAIWAVLIAAWQRQIQDPDHPYHWLTKLPEPDLSGWEMT